MAIIARDAMHKQGFFYVINHGLDKAEVSPSLYLAVVKFVFTLRHQVDRMIDIAAVRFHQVADEEKRRYEAKIKQTGTYYGYKLPQYWVREHSLVFTKLCRSTPAAHLEWSQRQN